MQINFSLKDAIKINTAIKEHDLESIQVTLKNIQKLELHTDWDKEFGNLLQSEIEDVIKKGKIVSVFDLIVQTLGKYPSKAPHWREVNALTWDTLSNDTNEDDESKFYAPNKLQICLNLMVIFEEKARFYARVSNEELASLHTILLSHWAYTACNARFFSNIIAYYKQYTESHIILPEQKIFIQIDSDRNTPWEGLKPCKFPTKPFRYLSFGNYDWWDFHIMFLEMNKIKFDKDKDTETQPVEKSVFLDYFQNKRNILRRIAQQAWFAAAVIRSI